MGSPVTFSGFNQVDFSAVVTAIMQQESRPLATMQSRQQTLQRTTTALTQLASKLDQLQDAAKALSTSSSLMSYSATGSDSGVTVSAGSHAVPGRYDVVVSELARNQVSVTEPIAANADATTVASGGTLTIGGVIVTLDGPSTLRQIADKINKTPDVPVVATLIETSPGEFRLVLSGQETGASKAFTVQSSLSDSALAFTDTDGDGVSGDSVEDNAQQAVNAQLTINNVAVSSASNTVTNGIPGVTMNLLQKDPSKTAVVTVGQDNASLIERVDTFATAYNALVAFNDDQRAAASDGGLGRDALLRSLRNELRTVLTAEHGSGDLTRLSQVGIGFDRQGKVTIDKTVLNQAIADNPNGVQALFSDKEHGVFGALTNTISDYTRSGGLVPGAKTRLNEELSRLSRRMDDMSARLAIRKAALQKEFIAADELMTRLNSQSGSLGSVRSALNL